MVKKMKVDLYLHCDYLNKSHVQDKIYENFNNMSKNLN